MNAGFSTRALSVNALGWVVMTFGSSYTGQLAGLTAARSRLTGA
jgi:hypothetical protein